MHRYITLLILLIVLDAPAAWADFMLTGSPPPLAIPAIPADVSASVLRDATRPGASLATGHADIEVPRFKVAEGFGDHVPLSFAVRQIVPPAVKVTYGPGADPDTLVDWRGGEGWNAVLFRAIRPLGLRLVMADMAVQIRK